MPACQPLPSSANVFAFIGLIRHHCEMIVDWTGLSCLSHIMSLGPLCMCALLVILACCGTMRPVRKTLFSTYSHRPLCPLRHHDSCFLKQQWLCRTAASLLG